MKPHSLLHLAVLLATAACAQKADTEADPEAAGLDPIGDEDGDGYSNGEEADANSDPLDASDVPYIGGWRKGDCRDDVAPTGDGVGQVAGDFALLDQFGETVHLHDFCDRTVMLEFSGFT